MIVSRIINSFAKRNMRPFRQDKKSGRNNGVTVGKDSTDILLKTANMKKLLTLSFEPLATAICFLEEIETFEHLDRSYLRTISNTRNSVSSEYPNTEKRVFNEIRGVWRAVETFSRV